jgi:hypothetical protein
MEITVNDFEARFVAADKTFVMTVPQAVLIRQPGTSTSSPTGAESPPSHQVVGSLTIRLSPSATWQLVEAFRLAAQLGRPIGEEPATTPSGKH